MSGSETTMSGTLRATPRNYWLKLAIGMAEMIRVGTLHVVLPDGARHVVRRTPEPEATIVLRSAKAARRLLLGGSLGLAEAYVEGLWESPSIRDVMRLAAMNEAEWIETLDGRPWMRAISRLLHKLRPNTRGGAKRNIVEHYDLGNEFYAEWLDPTMTYSSAMFAADEAHQANSDDLEAAQLRKMRHLCYQLELRPGMRVLEIGCGWGGFAELAAREYGVHVTGITLSPAQLEFAQARIAAAGLQDQVSLELRDYRDTDGQFDRIASIEMFEAVGEAWWPAYFATLRDRLAPGGRAGLQIITIADHLWESYRSTADFIQRHIFPGGMLPSPARLREEIGRAGLAWQSTHWFGQDYAETLHRWHVAFQARWPHLSGARRDARFKRLWEYYLAYCETGFRAGWTDVGQMILAKPG